MPSVTRLFTDGEHVVLGVGYKAADRAEIFLDRSGDVLVIAAPASHGFTWDSGSNARMTLSAAGALAVAAGVTATTGGLTATAGGVTVTAGGIYVAAGRISETLTAVDDDSQNMTLAAADILAGINVHTSATGGGTVTTDTAANIISGVPLTANDQTVVSYYVNDGSQTATFAGGSGVTVADTGSTVLTNEAAVLVWRRTSSSAVTLYIMH